jgi:hypothetical protein
MLNRLVAKPPHKEGYVRENINDQVTKKVNTKSNVIRFSLLKMSALKERPIDSKTIDATRPCRFIGAATILSSAGKGEEAKSATLRRTFYRAVVS